MSPGIGALIALAGLAWILGLRARVRLPVVLAVAVAARVAFLFVPVHSDDVYRYVWEGRIQQHGYSPYEHAPDDERLAPLRRPTHDRINHEHLPTIYPPLAQGLFRAAASLGLEETGLRNLVLLLDIAVVALLALWLRSSSVLIYAWAPLAVAGPVAGHVDPLMLLFLVGAAWAWERDRPLLAGALLGAAVLGKLVAVVLLPWMLIRRPRAAAAVVVIVLGYLPFGFATGSLAAFAQFEFNGSLYRLFGPATPLLFLAWAAWVSLSQPRIAVAGVQLLAGLLLCSPTVHFWYLSWFLVLLPAVGVRRWTEPLLLWGVTITATYPTYATTPPFVEHYGLTLLEYALPFALGVWLLARHWPRRVAPRAPERRPPPPHGVVIPCFGEADNLRTLLPRFAGAERVVVADTPTGDGTAALCDEHAHVVYVAVPERGYGAAVAAGLRALDGVPFAVVCDADHARGPDQVEALLAPFADPRVGLVTAARTNALPPAQRWGNALASLLIGLGWGRRFADLGPFRALRSPFAPLSDRGFGWNVEMNVRALEAGLEVVEVALPGSEREHGRDEISGTLRGVVGAGLGILRQLYRLREQACRPRLSS